MLLKGTFIPLKYSYLSNFYKININKFTLMSIHFPYIKNKTDYAKKKS